MPNASQPVVMGEVLFDLFEDGQAILGGAPFNVAWHLQGFDQSPLFISCVGEDKYGETINRTMQEWGMLTTGVQVDPEHSTGNVKVKLQNGQPSFDICNEVAYDYIDLRQADEALSNNAIPLLYHGSLAARHERGYDAILQMRQATASSFVDINLRPPWWNRQKVLKLIQGANWLKLNDDELISLTGVNNNLANMIEAVKDLLQEYDIESIILTRGEHGAVIISADDVVQSTPVQVKDLKDTVGAGDAFSSICILGLLLGWDTACMLNRATEFAAKICQQHGATQPDYALYESCKRKWQLT
jgi:fructokinase